MFKKIKDGNYRITDILKLSNGREIVPDKIKIITITISKIIGLLFITFITFCLYAAEGCFDEVKLLLP